MTQMLLTKIGEYQNELYNKLHQDDIEFSQEQQIQIGDDLYITGVYLSDKKWFVKVKNNIIYIPMTISLYCLSDVILANILNKLRMKIQELDKSVNKMLK